MSLRLVSFSPTHSVFTFYLDFICVLFANCFKFKFRFRSTNPSHCQPPWDTLTPHLGVDQRVPELRRHGRDGYLQWRRRGQGSRGGGRAFLSTPRTCHAPYPLWPPECHAHACRRPPVPAPYSPHPSCDLAPGLHQPRSLCLPRIRLHPETWT